MRIALQAKRKLGFVTAACTKESFPTTLHEDWKTCTAIVLSWIMNTDSPYLLGGIVMLQMHTQIGRTFKSDLTKSIA